MYLPTPLFTGRMNSMFWELKHFDQLSLNNLYLILQLRNEVFVVEQRCTYQDADNKDRHAYHLMGWNDLQELSGYARILPEGIGFAEASIGRVAIRLSSRRKGLGKLLMKEAIDHLYNLFGIVPIRIGAQFYLETFYNGFGFHSCSSPYLEDGISHIEMILI